MLNSNFLRTREENEESRTEINTQNYKIKLQDIAIQNLRIGKKMDSEEIKRLKSQNEIEKQRRKRIEIQLKTEKELHQEEIARNEKKLHR